MSRPGAKRKTQQPAPAGTPPTPTPGQALRDLAEAQVTLLPEVLAALAPEAARQVLHELRVHQIQLEMQNEELRRTQAQLDAERARYYELYERAPVGYLTLDQRGHILQANQTRMRPWRM